MTPSSSPASATTTGNTLHDHLPQPAYLPQDVAGAFFAAFGRGDLDAVIDLLAPDVEWEVPGDPAHVPWAGRRNGQAAVQSFFTTLGEATEREFYEVEDLLPTGQKVYAPGRFTY